MTLWLLSNWFENRRDENKYQSVYIHLFKTAQVIKFGTSTKTYYISPICKKLRGWLGFKRNEFKKVIVFETQLKFGVPRVGIRVIKKMRQ